MKAPTRQPMREASPPGWKPRLYGRHGCLAATTVDRHFQPLPRKPCGLLAMNEFR